jgi:SAM-dependent methyltransferase
MSQQPEPPPIPSTIAFYDTLAADYDDFYANRGWWAEVELAELQSHFQLRPTDHIADIGCGTGRLIPLLASQAAHVYACDLSASSIALLQAKCQRESWGAKVTPGVASMTDRLDLAPGSLDAVFNMQAYMLVPESSRRATLQEAARILKPGGRLFLQVYAHPTWILDPDCPKEHVGDNGVYYRCFDRDDLRAELVGAGWQVEGLYPIIRWPQLRRFGRLGQRLEMWLHQRPHHARTRCGYWLAVATKGTTTHGAEDTSST